MNNSSSSRILVADDQPVNREIAGMDDFVSKPASEENLAKILTKWLRQPSVSSG